VRGSLLLVLAVAACRAPTPAPTALPVPTVDVPGVATPEPTLELLARTELPVGVQVFEADVDTPALAQLRSAGVAWSRVRALWKLVEKAPRTPPRYDWTITDLLFGATSASGFRNVAVVYANPEWVSARECAPVPAEHMARYGAFWTALVERYDGDGVDDAPDGAVVRYWQVSNEVDFDPTAESDETDYGGCFGDDPAAYAEQLVVAWRAARAADPGARIGFGPVAYDRFTAATAPAGWDAAPGPFTYDFTQRALEHLYTAHAGDPGLPFFDFVGLHNYNDNAHFWDGPSAAAGHELVGKVARFRDEQLAVPGRFDLRDRPIFISETGLATSPSDAWTERSEALQAVYVGQTMVRALAAGAIAAIWYTARDNIFGDCVAPHYDWLTFGLMRSEAYRDALAARCPIHDWIGDYPLDSDATPRPALAALATLSRALAGTTFDRPLGAAETTDEAVEAYRFRGAGDRAVVVAWTTTGQRLGRRGVAPITATLQVDGSLVEPWSGRLAVTGHLGDVLVAGRSGAPSVGVEVGQAPVYLAAEP